MKKIVFNKPYLTGKEIDFIRDAHQHGQLSGNGRYTKLCQQFFGDKYGMDKCLLTTSCTHALEMSSILLNIQPGDEVILPSFTFVSTANAFALKGAKLRFVDSRSDHPGMDESQLESLINEKTKLIVPVHYAGVACDMDLIMDIAARHSLFVVEDAAQAIDSYYKQKPLGTLGHLATFSFHETKNLIAGEGGMIAINDSRWNDRSEIVWEKGTNRSAFFRGETDKYGWVDLGSSYYPSDMVAAFLYSQLMHLEEIQSRRQRIWERYAKGLQSIAQRVALPSIPEYATNNYHMFYLVCTESKERDELLSYLRKQDIQAVFHYQSLHRSTYFQKRYQGPELPQSERYSYQLVRLPFFLDLTESDQDRIIQAVLDFYS